MASPRITIINVVPHNPLISATFTTAISTQNADGTWLESEKQVHTEGVTPTTDGFSIEFNGKTITFEISPTLRAEAEALVRTDAKGHGKDVKAVTPKTGQQFWMFTARNTLPIPCSQGTWSLRPQLQWRKNPIKEPSQPSITWMVCPTSTRVLIAPVTF